MPNFNSKYGNQQSEQVQGLAELQKTLANLPDMILMKVLKKGLRKSAKIVQLAVQQKAPIAEGDVPQK